MTTSIQAKQDIETRVAGWVQTYADTITKNYRDYHIRTLKGNLSGNYPEYAREQLDEIENGTAKLMTITTERLATEKVQFMLLLIKKLGKFINLHHGKLQLSTLDTI